MAHVVSVYYGASREVTEQQALFLADGLEGIYAASPVAQRLAARIWKEARAGPKRPGQDIDLEDMEKYELLRVLDQAVDTNLGEELRALQAMLRGERRPGEPPLSC
jgi:hypothetical protein